LTFLESIILGAVQGVTEFLPVSSSAHLIIVPWLFKIQSNNINKLTFDVMLHFGTLFAVLLIYGKAFIHIVMEGCREAKRGSLLNSLLAKIILATCPAAILGFFFKDAIEQYLRSPYVTVFTLIAVSILMIIAERRRGKEREITYPLALLIGCAQAIALIPGISRSGITIASAILFGVKRTKAVDFSFLLSIPIISGVSLFEVRHLSYGMGTLGMYSAGFLSAFFSGALSLKFLIAYLKKHSLEVFAYYRIAVALIILFLS